MRHCTHLSAMTILLLFLCSVTAKSTSILDINGHPLEKKSKYFIILLIRGHGGGLTMLPMNKTKTCPLYVAQETHEISFGLPLKFYPKDPKRNKIPVDMDTNIVFDHGHGSSICVKHSNSGWMLSFDEATGNRYVGIGGSIGNPGMETLSNWFVISKAENGVYDYKISFCPAVCPACTIMCGDLGVFIGEDGTTRFLGITDRPLVVRFKKA